MVTANLPVNPPCPVELLYAITRLVTQSREWKPTLDEITRMVRPHLIYDNAVVYLGDPSSQVLDVAYARAAGRGRSKEADAAWGENLAVTAALSDQPILQEPGPDTGQNRLERPYILGIPLRCGQKTLGALLLVRFGGPPFCPTCTQLAVFIANQVALLVERQLIQADYADLERQHQQSRLQQDFISTVSHELRSPLGFIKGYTTTLLREDAAWDQATSLEFLKIIDQETDRLQGLIDNLLDSARLQSGELPMTFQPVHLEAILNDILVRSRLHYPALRTSLEFNGGLPSIQADPQRLAQVFENLVSNAAKYAPRSSVLITVRQENDWVFIDFKDTGPGIADVDLPFIFDRFYRSEQAANVHGTGLGLFICKKIIQAHNGEISAASSPGKGTTISIRLPKNPGTLHKQQEKIA